MALFSWLKLSSIYNKKCIGICQDDGLAVFKNLKVKKTITKMFKGHRLNITIQSNIKVINYLDIRLNLKNSTYQPYSKQYRQPTNLHTERVTLLELRLSRLKNEAVTCYDQVLLIN